MGLNEVLELLRQQHHRFLQINFPHGDGPSAIVLAQELKAQEFIGRDFEFQVTVLSDDSNLEFKQLLGKLMTVSMQRADGSLRHFNGHIFDLQLDHIGDGLSYYTFTLRPWLAFLKLRQDCYLFHNKTLYEQTSEILSEYLMANWEWRVNRDDPTMTDAFQFNETDHNYLHRRWEALGLSYWYEHTQDEHKLIICDDASNSRPVDGLPTMQWQTEAGSHESDGISSFNPIRRIAPTRVTHGSFDFKRPHPPSWAETPSLNQQGQMPSMEIYEWGGNYSHRDFSHGSKISHQLIEALEAPAKLFNAVSDERRAQPYRHFTLTGHRDYGGFNNSTEDAQFFILSVEHTARNNYLPLSDSASPKEQHKAFYSNRFTCIRKKIPWRAPQGHNSYTPQMFGVQTAIVVGPAGEEIYTDEYGRVKVQFHWDRVGKRDERSSAWVRVASTWAGSNFGFMAVPRIGQEVIVQWLDGNPDHPLITGRVYNQQNMPPWPLPANRTQTGILSRSTTKGSYDNANALRFEDKKGQEEVWLHAEKDQRIEVENNESHWVGNDRSKTIDHDETVHVKHDRSETVDHNETITIHNDRTERVDHNEKISIGDNRTEDVGQNENLSVGANRSKNVGKNEKDSIGKNWSIKVGKFKTETISLASMQNVGMGKMVNVGGAYSLNVGMMMSTVVGMSSFTKVGQTFSLSAGEKIELVCGSSKMVLTPDAIYLDGPEIHIKSANYVHIDGPSDILMNGGSAMTAPGGGN